MCTWGGGLVRGMLRRETIYHMADSPTPNTTLDQTSTTDWFLIFMLLACPLEGVILVTMLNAWRTRALLH